MPLVFLDNICVTLTGKLEKFATTLPISLSDRTILCGELGTTDHSYLTLVTPLGSEIVRVSCVAGNTVLERAQGGTEALTGAIGKCLCFRINKLILDEAGVTAACIPTITTTQPDYITITAPAIGECDWVVNINQSFLDKLLECCPDEEPCPTCVIGDGVYENATVTIINGKVCGIANGTNIVYTSGSSCGCP